MFLLCKFQQHHQLIFFIFLFFWIFFQPGIQPQILGLDPGWRYGHNANQNLGIMVIIIQNNKNIELLQPEMEQVSTCFNKVQAII